MYPKIRILGEDTRRDTGIQGYRDTGIQGYRDTGIQGYNEYTGVSGNMQAQKNRL